MATSLAEIWWKELSPARMREFMSLCEAKNLLRYPLGLTQRYTPDQIIDQARQIVRTAIKRGWAKYPKAGRVQAPLPASAYVCQGEYLEHDFEFVTGIGDCCARCGAQPTRKHSRANYEEESA